MATKKKIIKYASEPVVTKKADVVPEPAGSPMSEGRKKKVRELVLKGLS